MDIRKILIPLDDSPCSRRALDTGLFLAKNKKITITGMHVIRIPMVFTNKIKRKAKLNATKIISIASIMSKKHSIQFKGKIISGGYPGKRILEYANNNKFDLIVMGSRGPEPISEMFLGSVANYVISKSKIPVLIVK